MLFITNRKMYREQLRNGNSYYLFDLEDNNPSNNLEFRDFEIPAMSSQPLGTEYFMERLKDCEAKHIMFYIHGFDTLPNDALKTALDLQRLFDIQQKNLIKVVAIIWPGEDSTLEYWHAQKSADASAFGFHRALSKLGAWASSHPKNDPCRKQLHVLAHSMGARVLRESLIAYKKYDCPQGLPALFKNIFLAAPDLVNETLEYGKSGHVMSECTKYVEVLYAFSDLALKGSKIANLRGRRLGHSGIENFNRAPFNLSQSDCDHFNFIEDEKYGHTYFLNKACILEMVDKTKE